MLGDEVSSSVGVEDIEKESHIRPYTNLQSILYHNSRRIDSVTPTSRKVFLFTAELSFLVMIYVVRWSRRKHRSESAGDEIPSCYWSEYPA